MSAKKNLMIAGLAGATLFAGALGAEPLNDHSYWLGNSYPGGRGEGRDNEHVQGIVNDLAVHGDRLFGNSTWDEGGSFMTVYSTKDGAILGTARMKQVNSNWAEGAYGIAADADYVYVGGQAKKYLKDVGKDTYRNVVWRFHHDATNADFEGGIEKGNTLALSERFDFFVEPYGHDDMKKVSGLAVFEGELFVGDPLTGKIVVVDTETMKVIDGRAIAFSNPGWLAVDHQGFLWVVDRDANTVKKLTRGEGAQAGEFTGTAIEDVELPTGITVDADGNLLICDNGLDRQQVRTYDPEGKFIKAFGQPAYGKAGGDTFFGITAVASDEEGNIYTASHGLPGNLYRDLMHDRVGRGNEMAKFSPDGERLWDLHALEWVTCGDIDPGSESEYFTPDTWYSLDYSKPTQAGIHHPTWQVKAFTLDPIKYPNDLRLHAFTHAAVVQRVEGRTLMLVSSEGGFRGIYRFQGQTAVPVGLLGSRGFQYTHKMTGEKFPPNGPDGKGIWMDENGNGDFEPDEFTIMERAPHNLSLTPDGTMHLHDQDSITQVPFLGFNSSGTPIWDFEAAVVVAPPEDDIKDLIRVTYVPEEDIALVGCSTNENPMDRIGKMIGNEVRRYDNWSTLFDGDPQTNPVRKWNLTGEALPVKPSDGGHGGRKDKHMPTTLHAVDDDYFFVGYDLHSQPAADGTYSKTMSPEIRVYRMEDASFVGLLQPQEEIGFGTGAAMDIAQTSMCLHKLEDGRYFIAHEDYQGSKHPYYLWKPEDDNED